MNKAALPLFALLGFLAGCASQPGTSAQEVWHVDLRYTFAHERVIVSANGNPIFSGKVTTDDNTGLAKALTIPDQWDMLHLRVEVPATGFVLEKTLDARQGRYLGITKQFNGDLSLDQQAISF